MARRFRPVSLRLRMVLITIGSAALLLTVCGVLVVVIVYSELVDAADDVGEVRAEQVAELARLDVLPTRLAEADDVEAAVQVVVRGEVISSTDNATSPEFFASVPEQQPGDDEVFKRGTLPVDETGPFRVTALGTGTPRGDATVYVAVDVEDVYEFVHALTRIGGTGLLLLMLAVGFLFWVVLGRTLAPIADIQRRADTISDHQNLDQRVPEPQSQDEVGRLARTINAMLARLETSARRQERFVADAAHELRSPLANTRARLETALSDQGAITDHEAVIRDVLGENLRMSSMVDKLLVLARADGGELTTHWVPVDLDDLVREVLSRFHAGDVRVLWECRSPAQVTGEPALLEHVLQNLVENAVRHAHSSVRVTLSAHAERAVLTVDDDGAGIAVEDREEVFQRFVRLDHSRQRGRGGVGLGLAIVWQIVRAHHGTVEVADSPIGGARFRVALPLSAPSGDEEPVDDPGLPSAEVGAEGRVDRAAAVRPVRG